MSALQDYQLAALALDAYHRGYAAGMPDLVAPLQGLGSDVGTQVAGGVIVATASELGDAPIQTADFYAVAYLIDGEIVISYRGSDHLVMVEKPDGSTDVIGADSYRVTAMAYGTTPDQALLALDFYNLVQTQNPGTPITTTGHSLGGALAGYVAHLKNVPAVIFNNTSYQSALYDTLSKVNFGNGSPSDQTLASKVFGPGGAPWNQFGDEEIRQIALDNDIAKIFRDATTVDTITIRDTLDQTPAHYMALLTLAVFARSMLEANTAWRSAANAVFTQLSNDLIAENMGIEAANTNPGSGVMKDMIASTVLPGADNPFGNLAASSLINDMADIGSANWSDTDMAVWAEIAVRFATLQAKHAVSGDNSSGVIHVDQAVKALFAFFTEAVWTFNGQTTVFAETPEDFSTVLADRTLDSIERSDLYNGVGLVEQIVQGFSDEGLVATVGYEAADATVVVTGTGVRDQITGTNGNEKFLLGGGDDFIKPNGGVNWVEGSVGNDTLADDHEWSEFEVIYDQVLEVYFLALRDSGTSPRIHIVKDVELFEFAGETLTVEELLNVGPTDLKIDSFGPFHQTYGLIEATYSTGSLIATLAVDDENRLDKFRWEIIGAGNNYFTIDDAGSIYAKSAVTFDFEDWWEATGPFATYTDWSTGNLTAGFQTLLGSQYAITVKVTDAGGLSRTEDVFFWLEDAPVGINVIMGSGLADQITGTSGIDYIYGLAGADVIQGGLGVDWMHGGAGNDTIYVSGDYGFGEEDNDTLLGTGSNSYMYGGSGDDTLEAYRGTTGSILYGDAGSDTLKAWYNDVTLIGGQGGDTFMNSRPGTQQASYTVISYQTSAEAISFARTYNGAYTVAGGDAQGDVFNGYFTRFRGSDHADTFDVSGSGVVVWGGFGNDTITVAVGGGGSQVYGEDGDDIIRISSSTAWGGSGNDTIEILSGNSVVYGDAGDDLIIGGIGDDEITLGAGSDTFIFRTKGGKDRVFDLTNEDTIRLDGILAFQNLNDVSERLVQSGNNVVFNLGYFSEHADVYGANAPNSHLGQITFLGATVASVLAAGWEFV
jgi:Ca2+-binding RTX toxin-like protein